MKSRVIIILLVMVLVLSAIVLASTEVSSNTTIANAWGNVLPSILSNIKPPTFPNRDFYVTQFGAVGNGTSNCTQAFEEAIKACNAAGGGKVVVPAGKFLTGPIDLLSNVDLYLEKGATILFSTNTSLYSKPEVMGNKYTPLIGAYEQTNIAITGEGTLDGQANNQNWWPWKKEGKLSDIRPIFIRFRECTNILIQGVTIVNSPAWQLKPENSDNITIDDVKINSLGPNNDGIDVSSDKYVLIENSTFNTGDDCIALASGGGAPNPPVIDIVVRNDQFFHGHGALTIGSAVSNGASNVFFENCTVGSNLSYPWDMLRIKSNLKIGGTIQNVYVQNVKVVKVSRAIFSVNFGYSLKLSHMLSATSTRIPVVKDIYIDNVVSQSSMYVLLIKGYEGSPIRNVYLLNSKFENVNKENVLNYINDLHFINVTINGNQLNSF
ncbi:MAG: glycoside hydrolase family 28 protein [Candidatus Parvarchaeota archaeon]|nr:glycoside hydrolase family 28 protein [Candidatus Jingweiarchaeum tengchongense]